MEFLPIVIPLLSAALLAALNQIAHRRFLDIFAIVTAAATACLCLFLLFDSFENPRAYWVGGWTPRGGVAVGIALVVDPLAAGTAGLAATLMFAAFLYSWHYFEAVGSLFHTLMLVFLGSMVGFCFSGDFFNLFVFFELMGVAAYALTGYQIEEQAPLQGALNFAVVTSLGTFLILFGIALLYGRTGALNMAQVGRSLSAQPPDSLVVTAYALLLIGFFVKAAIVPFHFWLADAYAVAPTPVCVVFSGVMTELGIYAIARVHWSVFESALHEHESSIRQILLSAGILTSLVGGLMCFTQRHLKRLLAFSAVSHMGIFIVGLGLLTPQAMTGLATYVLSHGPVKGALFLGVGVLLHRWQSVDEAYLTGKGKTLPLTGVGLALGGLALAGFPPFGISLGKSIVDESAKRLGFGWLEFFVLFSSVATGGAVLRVAGRVFLGLGAGTRMPAKAPRDEEVEPETKEAKRPPPVIMLIPIFLLLFAGLLPALAPKITEGIEFGAKRFMNQSFYSNLVLEGMEIEEVEIGTAMERPPSAFDFKVLSSGALSASVAIGVAILALFSPRIPRSIASFARNFLSPGLNALRQLHTGHLGDYVTWFTVGAAVFGLWLAIALQ